MCSSKTLQQDESEDTSMGLELQVDLTKQDFIQLAQREAFVQYFDSLITQAFLGKETMPCYCV